MLGTEVVAALYAHAEAGAPEEVCGWLTDETSTDGIVRCENELHARDAYRFTARDTMRLDESLRSALPPRVVYHSHVDADGAFSADDMRAAVAGGALLWPLDWVVVEVRHGEARAARRYTWRDDAFVLVEFHGTRGGARASHLE